MNDDRVMVYNFWLGAAESRVMSNFKATREAIHRSQGGDIIESTAEEVGQNAVDHAGCYRRLATGWGELG